MANSDYDYFILFKISKWKHDKLALNNELTQDTWGRLKSQLNKRQRGNDLHDTDFCCSEANFLLVQAQKARTAL